MERNEFSIFQPWSDRAVDLWKRYRDDYYRHRGALISAIEIIGADEKISLNMAGSRIVGVTFRSSGKIHPAFSSTTNKMGVHTRKQKGRSSAEKAAILEMGEINSVLEGMFPDAEKIAQSEGFISTIRYAEDFESINGWRTIGGAFIFCQPKWYSEESTVFLYAADASIAIEYHRKRNENTKPATWEAPAGYSRVSLEEWNYLSAKAIHESKESGVPLFGEKTQGLMDEGKSIFFGKLHASRSTVLT